MQKGARGGAESYTVNVQGAMPDGGCSLKPLVGPAVEGTGVH